MIVKSGFAADRTGSVALIGALLFPVLIMLAAYAVDYGMVVNQRSRLQAAVDVAALAAARELGLVDTRTDNLAEITKSVVRDQMKSTTLQDRWEKAIAFETKADDSKQSVTVIARQEIASPFGAFLRLGSTKLTVTATAQIIGNPNLCVLALEPRELGALWLERDSKLTGNDCAVFSNSLSSAGLTVRDSGVLEATTVCSAGGFAGSGTVAPDPLTDCPQFEDPLRARPAPSYAGCDSQDLVVSDETRTLLPGVYCGGLTIEGTSRVTLEPGNYIITDGPLTVQDSSELVGEHVSFYLAGTGFGSGMRLGADTTISLSATTTGPLAGLLFFASRDQQKYVTHTIMSNNARILLGTIYMPNNSLFVDGTAKIGQESAYTAIVARRLVLLQGPHLVLNTDYHLSDVPVPEGIRGAAQPARLVQ